MEKCPQKEAIFNAIRTWQEARKANAFPRSIRKMLMNPAFDWHLEKDVHPDRWILFRMQNGKEVEKFKLVKE